jgi:hypothetical protein
MELDGPQAPARASARQAAQRYFERGWSVIPVPQRSKNPGFKRWEQLRLSCDQLDQHFNGQPQNISVLLGEPSDWLIDVDLDHPREVELAAQFLPPTALVFGRPAKPRSHWLYRVTAPLVTKNFSSRSSGMIVEVRSTGTHTVFPPSTHEIGEPIAWGDEQQEPAKVDPELLLASAQRLVQRPFAAIASINSFVVIGALLAARICAAASMQLTFFSFGAFAAFAVATFFVGRCGAGTFFAVFVALAFFAVDFLVAMVHLLRIRFDGVAAIIRPDEPPPSDAGRARVSAYKPSSSIRRLCSSAPSMSVSVLANHSTCRSARIASSLAGR